MIERRGPVGQAEYCAGKNEHPFASLCRPEGIEVRTIGWTPVGRQDRLNQSIAAFSSHLRRPVRFCWLTTGNRTRRIAESAAIRYEVLNEERSGA
jgi:hypothetical protein